MSTKFKRVWNAVTTALVVLVVILAILVVGVRLVGIMPYTVLSGSMEPEYHVGSIIYVWTDIDPLKLKVNDPVTFMLDENTVATHRIIEVIPDENDPTVVRFRTKGDANQEPDGPPLHSANVIGKPIFTIPLLGYFAHYVQQPPWKYIALTACIVLLLSTLFSDLILFKKESKKLREEEKKRSLEEGSQDESNETENNNNFT